MPAGLTKAAIVQAALDLLDEAGMDGLTVRALASRLGVQAPALYWHVRSKQALLDEMATQIWRQIGDVMAGLPADLPWREVMRTYAATVREATARPPRRGQGLQRYDADRPGRGPAAGGHLRRPRPPGIHAAGRHPGPGPAARLHHRLLRRGAGGHPGDRGRRRALLPGRRAELIGAENAPLAVEAGAVIFGEPDTRFTELVELLLDSVARMRSPG